MSSMQRTPRLEWRVSKVCEAASLTEAWSSMRALRMVGIRVPAKATTWVWWCAMVMIKVCVCVCVCVYVCV